MNSINYTKIIALEGATNENALLENRLSPKHIFVSPTCFLVKGGYIVFDFGKEIVGKVHIVFGFSGEGKIRLRTGESVGEVYAEIGEKGAGNHHSLRDAVYPVVPWNDFSSSETGFRFARIDVTEGEGVNLVSFYAEISENGLEKKGSFHSSDSRLDKIFDVACHTISLCVRPDTIWDGVKRDRVAWVGDFYPELCSAALLYGDIPQFKNVLDSISSFDGKWVNSIPAYSAWWLICLAKYFELSGDSSYVNSMKGYIDKIQKDFLSIVYPGGMVSYENNKLAYFPGNEFFLDWPTNLTKDAETGWRYLVMLAMKKAIFLCEKLGFPYAEAKEVLSRLQEYKYGPSSFKQVTALGVLAGVIDPKVAAPRLKEGGAEGVSAFLSFAIVEALCMAEEGEFALSLIKEYYGAMLDLGATSFWEDFDVDWLKDHPDGLAAIPSENKNNIHGDYGKFCYSGYRHSLCHGWSTGFLNFYSSYLLGVVPLEEGYKTIKVEPHLCSLTFAEGQIPTPYGLIKVKHEKANGEVATKIDIPDGIKVMP